VVCTFPGNFSHIFLITFYFQDEQEQKDMYKHIHGISLLENSELSSTTILQVVFSEVGKGSAHSVFDVRLSK
jgi:hypothetical protein